VDLFQAIFTKDMLRLMGFKVNITQEGSNQPIDKNTEDSVKFKRKPIITEHERAFLGKLKEVTDKYYLNINLKTRLADVFDIKYAATNKEWGYLFNRIKAKHIDFTILDSYYNVVCFVELDDRTHQAQNRKNRDEFIDKLCEQTGYKIIHTYGDVLEIEQYIIASSKNSKRR
jgi:hypothetical protein